jgi:hypothetical protein
MASQKSSRTMILDRFAAEYITIANLAIEEAGDSVRITGSVPTEEERQRALTLLGEAKAEGIRSTHAIEVRPSDKPADEAASVTDIRYPPEPA